MSHRDKMLRVCKGQLDSRGGTLPHLDLLGQSRFLAQLGGDHMRVFAKAIAAAVVMVSCAHAQIPAADAVATFRVGGVDFKLPLPSGYCLPVDKYIDVAQVVAATDNQNVTDLTACM
jgi:hypothetical protein